MTIERKLNMISRNFFAEILIYEEWETKQEVRSLHDESGLMVSDDCYPAVMDGLCKIRDIHVLQNKMKYGVI